MSNSLSKYFLLFVLLFGGVMLYGQPKFNSPYSRIGLGDLWNPNFGNLNGWGDLSAAFHDPYHINIKNPASYGHLYNTSFEVGLRAKYGSIEAGTETAENWSGNLSYMALGFPMKNPVGRVLDRDKSKVNWGMSFALVPYSNVGYVVETTEERPELGQVRYNFQGEGGTLNLLWGNGVKIGDFSVGANIGYLFGKIEQNQEVRFDSLAASYRDLLLADISHSGFIWNIGVQYDLVFKEKGEDGTLKPNGKKLSFGLYGNSNLDFNTKSTIYNSRFNATYSDRDTISFDPSLEGSGKLPGEFAVGIIYEEANKWRLGFNYQYAAWSNYFNEAKNEDGLSDTYRISIGGEFIPDIASYNSYARRVRYRFGAFYGTDPRSDGFNEQLTQYGITIGLGLPVILPRQQQSFVNLALELGQFGSEQFLRETYAQLTLGFTLNDNSWFFKRKFN